MLKNTYLTNDFFDFSTFLYIFAYMTNREFLSTLKKGDFIVAERRDYSTKLLACLDDFNRNECSGTNDYYTVNAIFFIGYLGKFRIGEAFGVTDSNTKLRRVSIGEFFGISIELKRHGYIYNRKTNKLIKR